MAQVCPTLWDPMDCSPPGSSVLGILQARILEWISIPFSRGSSWLGYRTQIFHVPGRFFTIWATGRPNHTGDIEKELKYPSQVVPPTPSRDKHRSFHGETILNHGLQFPHRLRSTKKKKKKELKKPLNIQGNKSPWMKFNRKKQDWVRAPTFQILTSSDTEYQHQFRNCLTK